MAYCLGFGLGRLLSQSINVDIKIGKMAAEERGCYLLMGERECVQFRPHDRRRPLCNNLGHRRVLPVGSLGDYGGHPDDPERQAGCSINDRSEIGSLNVTIGNEPG